jgi:hypothetical protein
LANISGAAEEFAHAVIPGRDEVASPESIGTGQRIWIPGFSRSLSSGWPLRAGPVGSAPE